jgi:hypothetical protein
VSIKRGLSSGVGGAAAMAGYLSISILFFGLPVLRHFSSRIVGFRGDPGLFIWDLGWWPHALANGLNPLYSKLVWAPDGVNLAWITGLPGPSVVAAPVTLAFGPIVAYNVLAILAPALSAWTAYLLFRHVTGVFWPSFAGGYFFGFSTYEIGHTLAHLNLTLVFLVPLAVLLVILHVQGRLTNLRLVVLLSMVISFQFLISMEVLLSMTGFGGAALLLAAWLMPEQRGAFKTAGVHVLVAYGVAGLALAPFFYYVLQDVPASPLNPPFYFSADLLNLAIPTKITLIGGSVFQAISRTFTGGDAGRTAYLGLPLIMVIALYIRSERRRAVGKLLTILFGLAVLASLGNRLHVAGVTPIRLPWALFAHLPILENALPVRFTMFVFLVAAFMVTLWLAQGTGRRWARWVLVIVSALFLMPNLLRPIWYSDLEVPPLFSTGLHARYFRSGDNVLILPLKSGDPMIWQAISGFSFRVAGGFTGPGPPHYIRSGPLLDLYSGRLPTSAAEFQAFLRSRDVAAVVLREGSAFETRVTSLLGTPPERVGGVLIYRGFRTSASERIPT